MEATPFLRQLVPISSGTVKSEPARFVETLEHSRFRKFSGACKQYDNTACASVPPGIGKTLSAVRYSRADAIGQLDPLTPSFQLGLSTQCSRRLRCEHTLGKVGTNLRSARERLLNITMRSLDIERKRVIDNLRERDEAWRRVYEGVKVWRLKLPAVHRQGIEALSATESAEDHDRYS